MASSSRSSSCIRPLDVSGRFLRAVTRIRRGSPSYPPWRRFAVQLAADEGDEEDEREAVCPSLMLPEPTHH